MPFAELTVHTHTSTPLTCAWVFPRGRASARHLGHLLGHFSPGSVTLTPMGWGTFTPTNSRLQILSHPPASFLSGLGGGYPISVQTLAPRLLLGPGHPTPSPGPSCSSSLVPHSVFLSFSVFPPLWVSVPHLWISIFPWLSSLLVYFFLSFLPACPILYLCSGSRMLAV